MSIATMGRYRRAGSHKPCSSSGDAGNALRPSRSSATLPSDQVAGEPSPYQKKAGHGETDRGTGSVNHCYSVFVCRTLTNGDDDGACNSKGGDGGGSSSCSRSTDDDGAGNNRSAPSVRGCYRCRRCSSALRQLVRTERSRRAPLRPPSLRSVRCVTCQFPFALCCSPMGLATWTTFQTSSIELALNVSVSWHSCWAAGCCAECSMNTSVGAHSGQLW